MAVTTNLVAVKGPQVAVVLVWSGSEGLPGSGNTVFDQLLPSHKSPIVINFLDGYSLKLF